jgi:hypothetical protein
MERVQTMFSFIPSDTCYDCMYHYSPLNTTRIDFSFRRLFLSVRCGGRVARKSGRQFDNNCVAHWFNNIGDGDGVNSEELARVLVIESTSVSCMCVVFPLPARINRDNESAIHSVHIILPRCIHGSDKYRHGLPPHLHQLLSQLSWPHLSPLLENSFAQ